MLCSFLIGQFYGRVYFVIGNYGSELPSLKPGTLRLYNMRFCPYAQRTRLVLEHKNIPYETINVDLKEKPDWFLERNPLGLVPVLEKDNKVIYESLITCDYLDEVYPNDKLNPDDPYVRARDRIVVELYSKALSEYYNILKKDGAWTEVLNNYQKQMEPIEKALGERGKFFGVGWFGAINPGVNQTFESIGSAPVESRRSTVTGDNVGMLDYMIWPWIERIEAITKIFKVQNIEIDVLPADRFPKLTAWKSQMAALPVVKATLFDADTHVKFFMSFSTGKPNFDIGLANEA